MVRLGYPVPLTCGPAHYSWEAEHSLILWLVWQSDGPSFGDSYTCIFNVRLIFDPTYHECAISCILSRSPYVKIGGVVDNNETVVKFTCRPHFDFDVIDLIFEFRKFQRKVRL